MKYCCSSSLKQRKIVCLFNDHFIPSIRNIACDYAQFLFYISRFIRPEEMDDEVTQIFKKWKLNNPTLPKKDEEIIAPLSNVNRNETFDTRTYTRPPKRRTFLSEQQTGNSVVGTPPKTSMTENEMQSIESGVCSRASSSELFNELF